MTTYEDFPEAASILLHKAGAISIVLRWDAVDLRYVAIQKTMLNPNDHVLILNVYKEVLGQGIIRSKDEIMLADNKTPCTFYTVQVTHNETFIYKYFGMRAPEPLLLTEDSLQLLNLPRNALKFPIEKLIAELQALPPGTTYEEEEGELWGGETPDNDLGTGYQRRINIVEGFNPPR